VNVIIFFAMFAAYLAVTVPLCAAIFRLNGAGDIALRFLAAVPLYLSIVAIVTFVVMTLKSRTLGVVANLLVLMLVPAVLTMVLMFLTNDIGVAILESNPFSMLSKTLGGGMGSLNELLDGGALGGVSELKAGTAIKNTRSAPLKSSQPFLTGNRLS
jgi:hypothetical protein